MRPKITIALQCHHFQRRLCWVLSSVAQQTFPELVRVDIAHMPDNGQPTTETVIKHFSGLNIKSSRWTDYSVFQRRGHVRTKQLRECRTEWILFADSDMIYHPEYFERLVSELQRDHPKAPYLLASGRLSTDIPRANELVDSERGLTIDRAFDKARAIAQRRVRRAGGFGNSQIVNVPFGSHGNCYIPDGHNCDWGWGPKGQNTKSDVSFRRRMRKAAGGVRPVSRWFWESVVHLNHIRDRDVGSHVEAQR